MQALSRYIAACTRTALPAPVTERTKLHLLDTLAAMVSGSRLLPGRRAIAFAEAQGGTEEACVIGSDVVTTAITAAMANGMHGHADETDDAYYLALCHPGCAVVPAALAMAERERASGTALLRAVALGYDICARTTKSLGLKAFHTGGFSTHSYGGTFGAAAAAGALAGLTADQVRHLVSYTAQQASGLSCWARDTEHVEKAFNFGGMPARNGVTGAVLVAMGCSGVDDVLSGDRNFFFAHRATAEPGLLVKDLGKRFDVMNTAIKRWPVGYPIQAPLDALSNILARHSVDPAAVEKVQVTIDETGAHTVSGRKMSSINIQHLVALMIVDREITFASAHDEARVRDRAVARIRERVALSPSAELSRAKTTQAIVEISLAGGRTLRHHTRAVRGSATNPMDREDVAVKARDLLHPVLGRARSERLIETVWNIDGVKDVRALRRLLRA